MSTRIIVETNVAIPMRDGVATRANVFRADAAGARPGILIRTPYSKDAILGQNTTLDPFRAVDNGFCIVFQDVRGRYESDGEFTAFEEAEDGVDSIQWLASQTWCDGRIGMTGSSYLGLVQWLAAARRPPHLRAMVPINIGRPPYLHDLCYTGGGIFKLGYVVWLIAQFFGPEAARRRIAAGAAQPDEVQRLLAAADELDSHARFRPLRDLPLLREHPVAEWYWDAVNADAASADDDSGLAEHYSTVDVPVLNVGGWYDYFLPGTLTNYTHMRAKPGLGRDHQRLLIGPWDHLLNSLTAEYDFGHRASAAALDFTGYQLEHFSHYLKGDALPAPLSPRVRLFVMGEGVWRDEVDWPLARARSEAWYLRAGGLLASNGPSDGERPDSYLYDPDDPAPTLGGAVGLPGLGQGINVGPYDQRPNEGRPDVVTYTSAVLREPIEVTGPIQFVLFAATSASDTDWIARLCDVHPDGPSRILAEGTLRARHRHGANRPLPLQAGVPERYEVAMGATSNLFHAGHRIRVDLTSSSFPYLEPNPNTGHVLGTDRSEDLMPALQTIFHDANRPSHVVLPVIPR